MLDSAIVKPVTDISDLFDSFKQGGFIVVFSEPTGYARVAANVEDAGFEVRDCLHIQVGESPNGQPATHLLSVLARKPFTGTVIQNVLTNGVGGLNIDACRIAHQSEADLKESEGKNRHSDFGTEPGGNAIYSDYSMVPRTNYSGAAGRFPANTLLVHDWRCQDECVEACPVVALNNQSGDTGNKWKKNYGEKYAEEKRQYAGGTFAGGGYQGGTTYADTGGASRYFINLKWSPEENGSLPASLLDYIERLITPEGGVCLQVTD